MMTPQTLHDEYSRTILLVDAQDVGRRRGIDLHVLVEAEAIHVAEVARLADPQDDRLYEAIEAAHSCVATPR